MSKDTDRLNAYKDALPTIEERLEVAQRLANQDPEAADPELDCEGHSFLVAHWGEDDAGLDQVGSKIYPVKDVADYRVGQSVAIFDQRSAAVIHEDYPILADSVVLHLGSLTDGALSHRFSGNSDSYGKARRGVRPPYLDFMSALPLSSYQRLTVDMDKKPTGKQLEIRYKAGQVEVPHYIGTVPLKNDPNLYKEQRNLSAFSVVMGNEAVYCLIKAVVAKAGARWSLAFESATSTGSIASGEPLPDLSTIFDQMVAA